MSLQKLLISSFLLGLTSNSSIACQDAWEFNSNDLTLGMIISFKNTTVIGKKESLSWIWSGKYSETWENKVSRSFEDGNIEGSLVYKSTQKGQKMQANLFWNLDGKNFSWVNSNKEIHNSFWSLNICQGINMKFHSNKDGVWEFKIDDYVIRKGNKNSPKEFVNNEAPVFRKKRSDEEFLPTEGFRNVTTKEGGVFDCIYNFFLGENTGTGRNDSLFTRIRNWVKGMACRLRGNCDGDALPPESPPITIPPVNPDAESFEGQIPSSSDNDV